jgi:hypothetical protein
MRNLSLVPKQEKRPETNVKRMDVKRIEGALDKVRAAKARQVFDTRGLTAFLGLVRGTEDIDNEFPGLALSVQSLIQHMEVLQESLGVQEGLLLQAINVLENEPLQESD